MIVLDQVHRQLSRVLNHLLGQAVLHISFLHQHIAAVFFVLEDVVNLSDTPRFIARRSGDPFPIQVQLNHSQAVASQVSIIDTPYHFRLLRINLGISIRIQAVAIQLIKVDRGFAFLHGLTLAPSDIGADGLTL